MNGYGTAYAIANASGNVLVSVGTGGVGCWAKGAGTTSKVIGYGIKGMDIGGNVVGGGKGVYDMYENGPSVSNALQVAGSGLGLAGNLKMKCFTAGTQIVVGMEYDENGNFVSYVTVNIEDIQVGDLVYSYDTATGEVGLREVTDTFVRTSDHINYLTIVDEDGNEQVIETTDGHPFWVVTDNPDLSRAARDYSDGMYHGNLEITENGFWVEAKDLRIGDVFLGASGELSTLTNAVRVEQDGGIAVFNFTVDGNHNYFILAKEFDYGQSCVLVHNTSPKSPDQRALRELVEETSNGGRKPLSPKDAETLMGWANEVNIRGQLCLYQVSLSSTFSRRENHCPCPEPFTDAETTETNPANGRF